MSKISWRQVPALALAAFFVVGSLTNIFAPGSIYEEYLRWGYPHWFHFVTGSLELTTAVLLVRARTRLWGAALGHGNLVYHAAGWQEGGLTASFEKLIIDVEMIQHMMEVLRPIVVDEAELAVEALGAVPTGGHFFGEPHTLERYATAFYQPMLSNWQNYEAWQEGGGLDATARATRLWKKALEDYVEPVMDPAVREALEAYMARRKEAIGQGEP
jgi:trimethylamine:corrinoid methyltransferase-like protein